MSGETPGPDRSPLRLAIENLAIGGMLRTPCHWKHDNPNRCRSAQLMKTIKKVSGKEFLTACRDKIFYVGRIK